MVILVTWVDSKQVRETPNSSAENVWQELCVKRKKKIGVIFNLYFHLCKEANSAWPAPSFTR